MPTKPNSSSAILLPSEQASREVWFLGVLALVASVWFFWTTAQPNGGAFLVNERSGYYGALAKGFLGGHLHVDIKPAPGLLALEDPYDPVANAPYRVHDMTLWKGNYYLYYGVSPVLVFFMPITVLTGWYPTEAGAVAAFCSFGVALALVLLGAVRRQHFPLAPAWALVVASLVVVFANPVSLLTLQPQFYEVPIAFAFALHMAMLGAIYRALSAAANNGGFWLAAASVCYGLSIGARPNYLLSGFALVVPWVVLVRRERGVWLGTKLRLGAAAFGPAIVAGIGLLLYNWLRFGVATEFGMKYTLGGERIPDIKLMGLENVVPHLGDYLMRAGNWGRYFPFFSPPVGVPHGALRYGPWLWLIPIAFLLRRCIFPPARSALPLAIAVAAGANLLLLCAFFGLTDRYPPDYVPAALLLAGIAALGLGERWRESRSFSLVGVGLAAITIFVALAVWVKRFPNPSLVLPVARLANTATYAWERWQGENLGGLRMEVELPRGREGISEPLVHTGLAADRRNWLQVDYLPENKARLAFFHAGLGMLQGREFPIPTDRRIAVELECGSLLPPPTHPMFADWTDEEQSAASRYLRVRVNGDDVLVGAIACYESTPNDLLIGRMGFGAGGVELRFTGHVGGIERVAVRRPSLAANPINASTPLEFQVILPADRAAYREPLITTGDGSKFDILFVQYAGLGQAMFGLYHHGDEPTLSQIVTYDPLVPHTLQVWMGSMAGPKSPATETGELDFTKRLSVVFNDKVILNELEQSFYPAAPGSLKWGRNSLVPDVVLPRFSGRIEAVRTVGFDLLPAVDALREFGAVDMTVVFPLGAQGAAEPLVVSGKEGAGNFIYLRYLPDNKMVFGFDHWGIGGIVSQPVSVDLWKPHRLRISMGSLYPAGEEMGAWRTKVQVLLDEAVVLQGEWACHPSTRPEVRVGQNAIGGSTCGPRFSGQIQRLERVARPEW